jgi:hypothetical protein
MGSRRLAGPQEARWAPNGWLGPRAGLNDMDEGKFLTLRGLELQPLCPPTLNVIKIDHCSFCGEGCVLTTSPRMAETKSDILWW